MGVVDIRVTAIIPLDDNLILGEDELKIIAQAIRRDFKGNAISVTVSQNVEEADVMRAFGFNKKEQKPVTKKTEASTPPATG